MSTTEVYIVQSSQGQSKKEALDDAREAASCLVCEEFDSRLGQCPPGFFEDEVDSDGELKFMCRPCITYWKLAGIEWESLQGFKEARAGVIARKAKRSKK